MSDEAVLRPALAETVIAILEETLGGPDTVIDAATSLMRDLGIDSLTMVRLDIMLRDRLGLTLELTEFEGIDTVGDLIEALATRGRKAEDFS